MVRLQCMGSTTGENPLTITSVVVSTPIPTSVTSGCFPSSVENRFQIDAPAIQCLFASSTFKNDALLALLPTIYNQAQQSATLFLGVCAYQVDVILGPQAMRHHRQRTVGVRRKVNPNHVPW